MKKIVISLILIVSSFATIKLDAMLQLPPCQRNFLTTPQILGGVELCAYNTTHAMAINDQSDIRFMQKPQMVGNPFAIETSVIQSFLMSKGVNIAREMAWLKGAPQNISNVLETIANTFDSLATPQSGLFGSVKKLYHYFNKSNKSNFEKHIEQVAAQAQKDNVALRIGIQGIDQQVETILIEKPSAQNLYFAIGRLIRNIKPNDSQKVFDFALHLEQVDIPKIAPKVTPTMAHALAYCKKDSHKSRITNEQDCSKSCNCKTTCPQTTKHTLCALKHILTNYYLPKHPLEAHSHSIFTTILTRAQLHPNYDEFFHAHNGVVGMLFDVMTELAKHMKLVGTDNPSPLFLRLFRKKFNSHGQNADSFIKNTVPSFGGYFDHSDLAKELEISVNPALAGNFKEDGESSLYYFLANQSVDAPSVDGKLKEIFDALGLPNSYVQKIINLYAQYPELNVGHLLQIFIPRSQTHNCVFLSKAFGIPLTQEPFQNSTLDPSTVLDVLPHYADDNFEHVNALQARILLNPLFAKDFIVYRYHQTPNAAKAAEEVQKKLKAIVTEMFAPHHDNEKLLVERIHAEQEDAITEGRRKLSKLFVSQEVKTAICEALAPQKAPPPQCYATIKEALTNKRFDTKSALAFCEALFYNQATLDIHDKNTYQAIELTARATWNIHALDTQIVAWKLLPIIAAKVVTFPENLLSLLDWDLYSTPKDVFKMATTLLDKHQCLDFVISVATTAVQKFNDYRAIVGLDYFTSLAKQKLYLGEARQAAATAQAKYEQLSADAQQALVALQKTLKN